MLSLMSISEQVYGTQSGEPVSTGVKTGSSYSQLGWNEPVLGLTV